MIGLPGADWMKVARDVTHNLGRIADALEEMNARQAARPRTVERAAATAARLRELGKA